MKKAEFVKEIESIYDTQQSKMIAGMRFTDGKGEDICGLIKKWISVEEYDKETGEWYFGGYFPYVGYRVKPCNAKTIAKHIWDEYESSDIINYYKVEE